MRIVQPSVTVHWVQSGPDMLAAIERAGRVAYKSEGKIGPGTAERFVAMLVAKGHESVLEHVSVSATVVCDRGVSHELVRHRIGSFTQTSTRFCNYASDRFGHEITVVEPYFLRVVPGDDAATAARRRAWMDAMEWAEGYYFALLDEGLPPQAARSVLPNSLKTELVVTFNLRQWRHFFALRCAPAAHPDMRCIAGMLRQEFARVLPVLFPEPAVMP